MLIELNYTPEELSVLLDGLNNAYNSLARNYWALSLGCDDGVPSSLRNFFESKNHEEADKLMKNRREAVFDLYHYLLTYEK